MALDITEIRKLLDALRRRGLSYFDSILDMDEDPFPLESENHSNLYWSQLDRNQREISMSIRAELLEPVSMISNCISNSDFLTEADRRDLSRLTKSLRASLQLRYYRSWDTEVLHDEGTVLGIQPAGQTDDDPIHPTRAQKFFERDTSNLLDLADLLEVSVNRSISGWNINPQITARYESNAAFIMMQIDPTKPALEDLYNVYKECFSEFGITAIRADEIEHQETITDKIIERIKLSEFLLADLTGERPSVYYEIGYAHALGKKVIMYRSSDTKLHFDLAGYNCPEYKNLSALRKQLMRRLEHITNRKPKRNQGI